MRFEFATAGRIIFGPGTLQEVGPLAALMGRCALVVVSGEDRAAALLDLLAQQGIEFVLFIVESEPTTEIAREGTLLARENGCDFVIGCGGGSVLDTAKVIAALLANGGDPLDYLEVIGHGHPLTKPSAPCIAIPTTAGTGAEVTRNAVLVSPEHRVKVSLRSPYMLPDVALIDPELTYSLPPDITAYTGLDALTQLIEPYVSIKANPMIDALCCDGIHRACRSLQTACEYGDDPAARQDMALASLFGGLALANAALGAVHGIAGPFGGMFPAPHGAICAALLPHVMAVNIQALQIKDPAGELLWRYGELARMLTRDATASVQDGIDWVLWLCSTLQIPSLSTYGVTEADFDDLIRKASAASSMKGNPIKLSPEKIYTILEQAL